MLLEAISADEKIDAVIDMINRIGLAVVVEGTKAVGVITKNDLKRYLNAQKYDNNVRAYDMCNRDFIYQTVDDFDTFDYSKLPHYIQWWPLLDRDGNLLHVYRRCTISALSSWSNAQRYEYEHHFNRREINKQFAEDNYKNHIADLRQGWDIDDPDVIDLLVSAANQKVCMEIGAGPNCGFMINIKNAKERIVIEPLAQKYSELRKQTNYELPNIDSIVFYPQAADDYIAALKNHIDGLIVCRNALDHTPEWLFVLSNISLYAKSGSCFYLNTYLNYPHKDPEGHFNITPNPNRLYRLLESLGFDVIYKRINRPDEERLRYYTLYTIVVCRKK